MVKTILKALFIFIGLASSCALATLPVIVTQDVPGVINQIRTMEQWAKQYVQMVEEIEQLRQTYKAITGNGMYGVLAFSPELVGYLPDEWQNIYNQVKEEDISGIKAIATTIMEKEGVNAKFSDGLKRYHETLATNKAMAMKAYDMTRDRLANINTLMKKANQTQNTKEAADLMNRISAENAIIVNEQTRISLMVKLQEIEMKLAEEQKEREFKDKFYR